MADERVQPGAEVSKAEYQQFKQFVQDLHGSIRGNLGRELERAMREYRQKERGGDRLVRIEDDVATIKAMLAEGEADGGSVIPTPDPSATTSHTHTPGDDAGDADRDADVIREQPGPKAPRDRKARWVAQQVRQKVDGEQAFSRPAIRKMVDDAWGFDDRTAEPLTDRVLDVLGAEACPLAELEQNAANTVAWGDTLDERWEERQAILEAEAQDDADVQFDQLDRADRDSDD